MKKIDLFLVFLFVFFLSSDLLAFEDIRYDISARFFPDEKSIEARETLSFKNDTGEALKEIYLRVYPHHVYSAKEKRQLYKYASYFKVNPYPDGFDQGIFQIDAVRLSDRPADLLRYGWEGKDQTVLRIDLDEPLADGASLILDIDFSMKIPHRIGRYGWHKNTFALNRWYPLLAVRDSKGWHKDPDFLLHMPYLSESSSYRLTLEVPRGYVVASGCDIVDEKETDRGTKTLSLSASAPLRELSLAISKDYGVYESQDNGITVRSYFLKKDEASARLAASSAADLIRYYARQFGPYPYKQFSIAPVYLGYGGSQNAGIIFLDTRIYRMPPFLDRYFDFLVSHETGHQWWYNMVGNDESRELWLDEGINSYWISRYLEDKYGPNAKIVAMPRWLEHFIPNPTFGSARTYRYWYFSKKGLDQPVLSDVSSFYEPSLIFTVAYGKGSAVLDMLASRMGEEKFSQAMRTYFERYKFKNATVEDFIRICNEISGVDLGWFFDEWLYGRGACDYAVRREKGKLILERLGQIAMPLETKLEFKDGTQEVVLSDGKKKREEIDIPAGKRLKKASVDDNNTLLDIDRVNNRLPRQKDIRVVPVYHGLYEIPLFIKPDAYSWITGPSFSQYGTGLKTSFQKPGDYIVYAASHYDFSSESFNSSVGFQKNNFLNRYMSWGVEFFNRNATGDEEDDLNSYKVYLRRELAVGYSVFEINSHLTLYLLHNQSLGKTGFLSSREEARNLNYRKNKETIFGVTYDLSDAGAYPDPSVGFNLAASQEIGGHVLGGGDAFSRTTLEIDKYLEIKRGHKLAFRFKAGAGYPEDKYLFYLGSDRELRGYDFKDIQGSSMFLGSFEYRFPLVDDLDCHFPYQILNLEQIQGVLFFDVGSAWYDRFNDPGFRKDAGLGFRFYFNVAGAAERFALRMDIAYPLDGEDKDTHLWVGINQAF